MDPVSFTAKFAHVPKKIPNALDIRQFVLRRSLLRRRNSRPHLPTHDQASSHSCRGILCAEDGNCRAFAAHANTQQKSSDKKLIPSYRGVSEGRYTIW